MQKEQLINEMAEAIKEKCIKNKDDLTIQLFKALSSMLCFYGMDIEKDNYIQVKTHKDAEEACSEFYKHFTHISNTINKTDIVG